MQAAFEGWQAWAEIHARHRLALADCSQRHRHQALLEAFRMWHANAMQLLDERSTLHMCCARVQRVCVRAAFAAWQGRVRLHARHQQLAALSLRRLAWHAKVGVHALPLPQCA